MLSFGSGLNLLKFWTLFPCFGIRIDFAATSILAREQSYASKPACCMLHIVMFSLQLRITHPHLCQPGIHVNELDMNCTSAFCFYQLPY